MNFVCLNSSSLLNNLCSCQADNSYPASWLFQDRDIHKINPKSDDVNW
ncbi:hypothetical protein V6x_54450 [Gimesia chilikensis]|uniref:Uncharacterized protein n=1 Tax=Gimesia chilikensis TaxID=2605989 RepID=A0A517WKC7_9PLAN|nr:hypothetical protein V6x_54450 [Gimesia chilikensis]